VYTAISSKNRVYFNRHKKILPGFYQTINSYNNGNAVGIAVHISKNLNHDQILNNDFLTQLFISDGKLVSKIATP
jgi:hypothetical protein